MCQCSQMEASTTRKAPRYSVFTEGEVEALQFKWIESEKAGRDLGEWAIRCWVREHWHGFLRHRWLEHLQGRTFWIELDHDDFGLLLHAFRDSELLDEVLWRLKCGWENLEVLCWALDERLDMDEVIDLLEMLDINSRRIECQFAFRLSHAS
ncbi:MAG: hypothetical protein JWN86_4213 [Planctomycetota bacterium]|nr:hypothetical protein [Planctomycetota bacterium]